MAGEDGQDRELDSDDDDNVDGADAGIGAEGLDVTTLDGDDTWLGEPVPFGAWDE